MNKDILEKLYTKDKLSVTEIANKLNCSSNRINYWLFKHGIQKRTISEAIYQKNNPTGDPFEFNMPKSIKQMFLYGLGLGLYWGEGTKRNKHSIRLGNTDPDLIKSFINFLVSIYNIDRNKLKFQLLIYDDLDSNKLIYFWAKYLSIKRNQFSKTTILKRRGEGTYNQKMKYGLLLIIFNNIKLRDLICSQIANIKNL